MQRKHIVVDPDKFELSMSISPARLVFLTVETIRGETIKIPFSPDEAIRMGIGIAGVGHAVRRAAANDDATFNQDLADLAELVNNNTES
ncbi:MAG: hypothetical protein WA944_19440 [Mycobacterium sp.]